MKRRSILTAGAALCALLAASAALAEGWKPERPMTMVIGFAAGGSTDIQGRVLARTLEEHFGQPVNVVNQPGGGGAVALTRFLNAAPDGHTFMFGVQLGLTFSPVVTETEYDIDDFRYAGTLVGGQFGLVAAGDAPFQSFDELIAHGQENPMTYAQQLPMDQAIMQQIAAMEGIDLAIVPTGGGGGMAPLLLGGEVDFAFSGGTHAQYTPTGEMNVLAFLTRERSPFYPDVPTLAELGYPYAMDDFRSFFLPGGTPDEIVQAFEEAARFAVGHEPFVEVTVDNTLHPIVFMDAAETEATIREIRAANEALMAN
ncbi:tripartite tricarboxylate transporter substrate binding protein [Natronohydrobacter thiooxidans]|jgi:tripartite-type tricarboxylate transporter receptor subunit TctC|uniref:tripartite tricarboxylate transporter substrate binding protein n=1 Tax=Natronohydrobacter thiooxidans TaxID=87172 RepID=UPI0008FF6015|nr:tripartite tricarboxylate transporter substrate binding protein [Natronohydrobacter thiooxidans]